MTTPILIDPLLFSFAPDTLAARLEDIEQELNEINKLESCYPVDLAGFLSSDFIDAIFQNDDVKLLYSGRNSGDFTRLLNKLQIKEGPQDDPAEFLPYIELNEIWRSVLAEKSDESEIEYWRNPVIMASSLPDSVFPDVHEIDFKVLNGGMPRRRNLVKIGKHKEHPYFERDLDPWRLNCVGEANPLAPLAERRATCRQLPRHPGIPLTTPILELADKARSIKDCTNGTDTTYWYLPELSWNPTNIGRDAWRNDPFDRGNVLKKNGRRESGYLDRNGHIWVWDIGEPIHWDVKTQNDVRIARVRYDGLKLPMN